MPTWTQSIVIDGQNCLLLLPEINWRIRPKITHRYFTASAEGRTGIEARASEAAGMMLSFEFLYTLKGTVAQEVIDALDALDPLDEFLAVPIWPDKKSAAEYAAGARKYSAQHYINLDPDTGAYSIDADGGHPVTMGLAVCALVERPRLTPRTDMETDILIRAEEDSPWESRVDVNELAHPTWDFSPNWSTLPDASSRWQLQRRRMGQGRRSARTGTLAPAKQTPSAKYTFRGEDTIRKALTFWRDHFGPYAAFTIPKNIAPDGTDQTLQVTFADESLTLEYSQLDVANARIAFDQDLLLDGGEPSQQRPSRAYLYRLQWDGGTTVFAWTDWAKAYTYAGVTYQPGIVEHRASNETLKPGQSDWQLLVYDFEGNPLRAFGRLARERRLLLSIYECDPAVANTATMVFDGEIKTAPNKGPIYTATAALFGGALRAQIPQTYCQTGCNNVLGDDLCGIDLETLREDGVIAVVDASGTIVDITCGSAQAADYYPPGFLELGAGDGVELRFIIRSEPIAGGQRFTLHRPLWTSEVGTAAKIYPGCDQQYEGGCARYANQGNFFGAPWKVDYINSVDSGFRTKLGK
jgi:hypothetical protein